jgi:hypothetical protein
MLGRLTQPVVTIAATVVMCGAQLLIDGIKRGEGVGRFHHQARGFVPQVLICDRPLQRVLRRSIWRLLGRRG